MKKFVLALICILSISSNKCFAFEESKLIKAIDNQDINEIFFLFDHADTIGLDEAKKIISNLYRHYINIYGEQILTQEYWENLDMLQKFYQDLLIKNHISLEKSLISNKKNNYPTKIFLCKNEEEEDIPSSIILGGIEIIGGALVWIIPHPAAKMLGTAMIGDGMRRAFNGVEEADKNNKNKY